MSPGPLPRCGIGPRGRGMGAGWIRLPGSVLIPTDGVLRLGGPTLGEILQPSRRRPVRSGCQTRPPHSCLQVCSRATRGVWRAAHHNWSPGPEVVSEAKIGTPPADVVAAHLQRMYPEEASTPGAPLWRARSSLGAWEKLVRQMDAAWHPPAGIRPTSTASDSKRTTRWSRYAVNSPRMRPSCSATLSNPWMLRSPS